MKISADNNVTGPVLRELHDASVDSVLLLRTGPGWMLEFVTKIDPAVVENITQAGGVVMPHAAKEPQ